MLEVGKAVVMGAGTMGQGIAQWLAQVGVEVYLSDIREEAVHSGLASIQGRWSRLVEKKRFSPEDVQGFHKNLRAGGEGEIPWDGLDIVIEAVVEDLAVKTELFRSLPLPTESPCIIASNTSSLSIARLAEGLPSSRRHRFLGLHFFNPAPVMKLVEVVAGPSSDSNMCQDIAHWLRKMNKVPALCRDKPGFIVNRVARNFYGEALRIGGEGKEEDCREVDEIMKKVGGFRMGPFELMDLIGIDVNYQVTCSVWEAFDRHPRFAPHPLQRKLVEQGRWGKKTGGGFYS